MRQTPNGFTIASSITVGLGNRPGDAPRTWPKLAEPAPAERLACRGKAAAHTVFGFCDRRVMVGAPRNIPVQTIRRLILRIDGLAFKFGL